MPATRLPLTFARTSAWLAVGMLLFPWAELAQCQCGPGSSQTSSRQSTPACCCQSATRSESCCGAKQKVQTPSCCNSSEASQCGPDCHCGCSRKDSPQPPQTPQPASSSSHEQISWGLVAPTAAAGYAALGSFSPIELNQFQQLISVSALDRCIALSRFTC